MMISYCLNRRQIQKPLGVLLGLFLVLGAAPLRAQVWQEPEPLVEIDMEVRENSIVMIEVAQQLVVDQRYEKALEIVQRALQDDPYFHPAYQTYYSAASHLEEAWPELITTLEKATREIFREDDELIFYMANGLYWMGRFPEALARFDEAIHWSKVNGEDFYLIWNYHFNRGNCLLKMRQYALAVEAYDEAARLNPVDAGIFANRGICHHYLKNAGQACADWQEALDLEYHKAAEYIERYCDSGKSQ
ncbi:tetratricopeptide repeat protein [Nitritalea halalkaliphila]|nr:tetratricopeptide repeat protein [Nitritalea halalkaliphila]